MGYGAAIIVGTSVLLTAMYLVGVWRLFQEQLTDRFFSESAPQTEIVLIAIDDESIESIGQWPWKREVFARALLDLANAKAVGIDVSFTEPSRHGTPDDEALVSAIETAPFPVLLPATIDYRTDTTHAPLDTFANAAHVGIGNVETDRDGIVRRSTAVQKDIPSFSTALLSASDRPQSLHETYRIRFRGHEGTFLTIPFIDLISGDVPPRITENKIVIIGATAPNLHDTFATPVGQLPGIEVHANALATQMRDDAPRDISPILAIVLFVFVNTLAVLLSLTLRRLLVFALTLAGLLGVIVAGASLAFSAGIIVPHFYAGIGLILTALLSTGAKYILTAREKAFIRRSFATYVAPDVVDELSKHPEKLTLGGETKTITVFFSDIRGFTSIAETLSAEALMDKLNQYFHAVTSVIQSRRGLVDKYIGDAVMAFWGAPLENARHAEDACASAIEQAKALEQINSRWRTENEATFAIGMGISTGEVVVGNMGSLDRFNYTIIGDEVNFTSRLEGLNKAYGTVCLVSESTVTALPHDHGFTLRELDTVRVKGKREPRVIYELMTTDVTDTQRDMLTHFAIGRHAYNKGEWDTAIDSFKAALVANPNDGPSQVFLERSQELKANPPTSWDGVYAFSSK